MKPALFNEGLQLDTELSHIMTKMRTQDETKVSTDANNDSDSIDFF